MTALSLCCENCGSEVSASGACQNASCAWYEKPLDDDAGDYDLLTVVEVEEELDQVAASDDRAAALIWLVGWAVLLPGSAFLTYFLFTKL